jgi:hypothetical protein
MGFNLKKADSGNSFAPIPADTYFFRVDKAEMTVSQQNNPMISLQLAVEAGTHKGRIVFDQLVLAENNLWKIKSILEAIGSDLINSENVEGGEIADALRGKTLNAKITISNGTNGNPKNNVKAYLAPSAPAQKSGSLLV